MKTTNDVMIIEEDMEAVAEESKANVKKSEPLIFGLTDRPPVYISLLYGLQVRFNALYYTRYPI